MQKASKAYAVSSVDGVSHSAAGNGNCYSSERDETNYLARRRETLARLSELPAIPVSGKALSTAEILRQIREEEAR